jgi:hypothetical protein
MAGRIEAEPGTIPPLLWNSPPRSRRRSVVVAIGACFGALLLFAFNPVQFAFYPVCQFYHATGLLCPGCGTLRACHQLLHGHVLAALHLNPLAVLAIPIAGMWLANRLFGTESSQQISIKPAWLWIGAGLLIVFSIVRNLPIGPMLWLAP